MHFNIIYTITALAAAASAGVLPGASGSGLLPRLTGPPAVAPKPQLPLCPDGKSRGIGESRRCESDGQCCVGHCTYIGGGRKCTRNG